MENSRPSVHIELVRHAYNLLIHALMRNATDGYGANLLATPVNALVAKIESQARLFVSAGSGGEPIEYAEITLLEQEAAEVIWQLVLHTAGLDVPSKDYYAQLEKKHGKTGEI